MIPINKYYASVVIVMAATTAQAQTPVPPSEYSIKLTAPEVDIVGKALGAMPYSEVALIIQKLRQQIVDQQSPKIEEKKWTTA